MRQWRDDKALEAVTEFLRLAGAVQLAVQKIARAGGGIGHPNGVEALDEALLRLNLHVRVLEASTPWLLSGRCWRSVGEIEDSVGFLREPSEVQRWVAGYSHALQGLPDLDIWIQGCVNYARREFFRSDWDSNRRVRLWQRVKPHGIIQLRDAESWF